MFFDMCLRYFSPNRFTCEGFLLLWRRCMLGPHDFTFVSGLVYRKISGSACLPLVFHYTGCSECFGPHDSHLSPSKFWMLWVLSSNLSPTTLWILCPHDFTLVSHLSPLVSQYTRTVWFAVHRSFYCCFCRDCCLRSPALICVSLTLWFAVHRRVCCCSMLLHVATVRLLFVCPWGWGLLLLAGSRIVKKHYQSSVNRTTSCSFCRLWLREK